MHRNLRQLQLDKMEFLGIKEPTYEQSVEVLLNYYRNALKEIERREKQNFHQSLQDRIQNQN